MAYVHDGCGGHVKCVAGPEPGDPDRHGNHHDPYRCEACGDRFTVTWVRSERRHLAPSELTAVDDRGVDPAEVCG